VITKVNYSEWAALIVVVPKPGGSVRICSDYKVTTNPVLEVDNYLLPTPVDLFAQLQGQSVSPNLTYHRHTNNWN